MSRLKRLGAPSGLGRSRKSPMGAPAVGSIGAFGAPGPNVGGLGAPTAPGATGFSHGGAVQRGHHTKHGFHSMEHQHDDSRHGRGHSEHGFEHMSKMSADGKDEGMSATRFAMKHGGPCTSENSH